jgi:hypothetical protein
MRWVRGGDVNSLKCGTLKAFRWLMRSLSSKDEELWSCCELVLASRHVTITDGIAITPRQ